TPPSPRPQRKSSGPREGGKGEGSRLGKPPPSRFPHPPGRLPSCPGRAFRAARGSTAGRERADKAIGTPRQSPQCATLRRGTARRGARGGHSEEVLVKVPRGRAVGLDRILRFAASFQYGESIPFPEAESMASSSRSVRQAAAIPVRSGRICL